MSSLSAPLQAVVDLFSGPLQGVRFAEIDADTLSTLATEVESIGSEVEVREAELASLREALSQKQEVLNTLAQQALAYARIYAESDEALSAELDEIALPRAGKPRKAAAVKAPGAKAAKDATEASGDSGSADVEALEPEPVAAKPARKAVAPAAEPEEEVAAPAKAGRRKVPTRRGR